MKDAIRDLLIDYQQGDIEQRLVEAGSVLAVNEVLNNLSVSLESKIKNLKSSGDRTHNTLIRQLHKENTDKGRKIMGAAATLYKYSLDDNERRIFTNKYLEGKTYYLSAMNNYSKGREITLPKESRLYFFVDVISAWKLITGDKAMPRREQVKESVFSCFLERLFNVGGSVTRAFNVDEAHRNILKIEKEMPE